MKIGYAIKQVMDEKGITQYRMAKDLNYSRQYVSAMVNEKFGEMKLGRAYEISQYLGVTLEELVELAEKLDT